MDSGRGGNWITSRAHPGHREGLQIRTVEVLGAWPGELWPFLCVYKGG